MINHSRAFAYIKEQVSKDLVLNETTVKDIHALLMEKIIIGGIYRNVEVRITGAGFNPPAPDEMYRQIKDFFVTIPYHTELNPIELAAYTHAEFVKIHPFIDGNGRTSRMLMNYQLMINGYLPVSIAKENRLEYFDALEAYAVKNNLTPFVEMIASLEEIRLDEYLTIKTDF